MAHENGPKNNDDMSPFPLWHLYSTLPVSLCQNYKCAKKSYRPTSEIIFDCEYLLDKNLWLKCFLFQKQEPIGTTVYTVNKLNRKRLLQRYFKLKIYLKYFSRRTVCSPPAVFSQGGVTVLKGQSVPTINLYLKNLCVKSC